VELIVRVTFVMLDAPGLRAGIVADLLGLAGLARVKAAGAQIFSRNVASARPGGKSLSSPRNLARSQWKTIYGAVAVHRQLGIEPLR
jgi:hypothetical protein